jgi:hypothetical protein
VLSNIGKAELRHLASEEEEEEGEAPARAASICSPSTRPGAPASREARFLFVGKVSTALLLRSKKDLL